MPPSDTTREGGQPHIVQVGMLSEFTGGYIKVGKGAEEEPAYDTRQAAYTGVIQLLEGVHVFSSRPGLASRPDFDKWTPEIRRIAWTDKHLKLRLDDAGVSESTAQE